MASSPTGFLAIMSTDKSHKSHKTEKNTNKQSNIKATPTKILMTINMGVVYKFRCCGCGRKQPNTMAMETSERASEFLKNLPSRNSTNFSQYNHTSFKV